MIHFLAWCGPAWKPLKAFIESCGTVPMPIYSKFGRHDKVKFFDGKPGNKKQDKGSPETNRRPHQKNGKLSKAAKKNPKMRRAVQMLTKIATYHLWPAFQERRANGDTAEDAAAKVVAEYRSGCW